MKAFAIEIVVPPCAGPMSTACHSGLFREYLYMVEYVYGVRYPLVTIFTYEKKGCRSALA